MVCQRRVASGIRPGVLAAGSVLMAVGAGMLLDRYEVLEIHPGQLIAPVVMIVLGVWLLLGAGAGDAPAAAPDKIRERRRNAISGGVSLIGLGTWLLVSQTQMFGLTFGTSWPLLLILWGALITMRGWR